MLQSTFSIEGNYVINRSTQSDHTFNMRRAGFELKWNFIISCFLKRNRTYHFTASLVGWHLFQQVQFPVKTANAGWSKHFMSRKSQEIAVELLYIKLLVSCSLG